MAGPHGQCLCLSGTQLSPRNVVSASLPRGREEGKLARVGCCTGTYSSTTSPAFHLAVASRGGYIHSTFPGEGARCCSQDGQVCGAPDSCKEDVHKSTVSELVWAAVGSDTETVCASMSLGDRQPAHHILSRSMGPFPRVHPPIRPSPLLVLVGYLLLIYISLAILSCFPWMQCVGAVLVDLHKPLVLFRVLSLRRHLPQGCTLQQHL